MGKDFMIRPEFYRKHVREFVEQFSSPIVPVDTGRAADITAAFEGVFQGQAPAKTQDALVAALKVEAACADGCPYALRDVIIRCLQMLSPPSIEGDAQFVGTHQWLKLRSVVNDIDDNMPLSCLEQ